MNSLLVELLTEELPPKALKKLGEAFAQGIAQGLAARKLTQPASQITGYATPRRLAVLITQVAMQAPDQARRDKVLPVNVAFDAQGKPQPPLLKKLAAMGLSEADVPKLERAMDGKAEALFYSYTAQGQALAQALQEILTETVAKLPIPKVMFYERDDGTPVNFVRPAHKLIALHGSSVLPVSVLGVHAGDTTLGHRFHHPAEIKIETADSYEHALRAHGKVIASYSERRTSIEKQLNALAKNDEIIAPDALLDEVTSLVEWPVVYECHFEARFLEVPQECLILTMQTNQKYFATRQANSDSLTPRFLIVSNVETNDPTLIISGNERVIRPRLADAKFFFDQDRKYTLESRIPRLDRVVYHNKLGSQGERVKRIVSIATSIAQFYIEPQSSNRPANSSFQIEDVANAASLAKADLLTDMVGEFPELQGTMGKYYAQQEGLRVAVCEAIEDHYKPRFAGDPLPRRPVGSIVALADKLETLIGLFGVDQAPTGDKDPFALRRHAIGVLRLLTNRPFAVGLTELIHISVRTFGDRINDPTEALLDFIYERAMHYYSAPPYNFDQQQITAVISLRPNRLAEINARLPAVRDFAQLPEAESLAAANKRIGNILKKSDAAIGEVNPALFTEDAEKHLFSALRNVEDIAKPLFHNDEYAASLRELASLRGPVDAFFDKVMVNADDPKLKANRLALLQTLHTAMNRVADLSKLAA
jgi:glycyl-tRNA synthetase beta chain